MGNFSSVSTYYLSFFHYTSLKWNMRDPNVSLHVFKSRLKIHLEKDSNTVPIQVASTWPEFRFK